MHPAVGGAVVWLSCALLMACQHPAPSYRSPEQKAGYLPAYPTWNRGYLLAYPANWLVTGATP